MKQFIKNNWKVLLTILIIILGFLFYYEILPRYNQTVLTIGYNQALNDLTNQKAVPLRISQQQGNETINQIIPVGVCSEVFQKQYQNICEVKQ